MVDEIQNALDRMDVSVDSTIEKLRKKLLVHDIKILDSYTHKGIEVPFIYKTPKDKIPVECSKGHKWFTYYSSIVKGSGCRTCHLARIKDKGLAAMKKYSEERSKELEEIRRIAWEERKRELEEERKRW